jgi:SAM-dependent methyltransferase
MERTAIPLISAVLDAGLIGPGTRLVDVGCGSGLALLLASVRGAQVAGIDAAENLVEIARDRVPSADLRVGDMEDLPWEDGSFDVAIAINSVFHSGNMLAATRELRRVVRPSGRVVVTSWATSEECESRQVNDTFRSVLPAPPPPSPEREALTVPGGLRRLLERVELVSAEEGSVACQAWFADADESWRAHSSAGPAQHAIRQVGEVTLRIALAEVDARHTYPDGSVRYQNHFRWAVGLVPDS